MKTSAVVPAYNGKEYLKANLPVVMVLPITEVIVIDDASSDGSEEFISENFPRIKLITHAKNLRFPLTVNEGFRAATGEIIFLLNQDVKPDENLVKNTLRHFLDPKVFAVTFNEGKRSWAKGEWKDGFFEFTNGPLDKQLHESAWASGGSAAFRKSYWTQLGGFDPIFTPGYFEDLDLGLRAHRAGYKILWDPACRVEHVTETAFKKAFSVRQLQLIKDRNYLLANWKNIPPGLWTDHLATLIKRIVHTPGYLIPVAMAIWRKLASS